MVQTTIEKQVPQRGHKAYVQLSWLGFLLHASQALIFFVLNAPLLCIYNLISTAFYLGIQLVLHKRHYRLTVVFVHTEVCLFTVFCTIMGGWQMGFQLYLLACASLVYFCPFKHRFISYIFSLSEMLLFLYLRFFHFATATLYPHISAEICTWLYLYSGVCCFGLVMFASFSSNLSSVATYQQLQQENADLQTLASRDFLTGLLSRRAFFEQAQSLTQKELQCVAIGDIDDFKRINDTYGHSAGDQVLHQIGQSILAICQPQLISCRWGGEEFVLLFQNLEPAAVLDTLHTLCATIQQQIYTFSGNRVFVTITFGMHCLLPNQDLPSAINQADTLLYQGKKQGKNQVVS